MKKIILLCFAVMFFTMGVSVAGTFTLQGSAGTQVGVVSVFFGPWTAPILAAGLLGAVFWWRKKN